MILMEGILSLIDWTVIKNRYSHLNVEYQGTQPFNFVLYKKASVDTLTSSLPIQVSASYQKDHHPITVKYMYIKSP